MTKWITAANINLIEWSVTTAAAAAADRMESVEWNQWIMFGGATNSFVERNTFGLEGKFANRAAAAQSEAFHQINQGKSK